MSRTSRVAQGVRQALVMSAITAAGAGSVAYAQEETGAALEEFVVTGSRIRWYNVHPA